MKCREIKRKLSAFQDKELPEFEMKEIERHLRNCSACSQALHEITSVWHVLSRVETIESAPFFWTRLSHRLKEREIKHSSWKSIYAPIPKFAFPVLTILILFFGLVIGIYLGQNIYHHSELPSPTSVEDEMDQTLSLSSFDDFPEESVADVYVTLLSEDNH